MQWVATARWTSGPREQGTADGLSLATAPELRIGSEFGIRFENQKTPCHFSLRPERIQNTGSRFGNVRRRFRSTQWASPDSLGRRYSRQ